MGKPIEKSSEEKKKEADKARISARINAMNPSERQKFYDNTDLVKKLKESENKEGTINDTDFGNRG